MGKLTITPRAGVKYAELLRIVVQLNARIEELEYANQLQKAYSLQQGEDAALIAAHQTAGFGGKRNADLRDSYVSILLDIMDMAIKEDEEQKDNKEERDIIESCTRWDRLLREALGGELEMDYDARYAPDYLLNKWIKGAMK